MPTYVTLMKLTEQGIKNIKGAPLRIEDSIKALESAGGRLVCFYSLLGEYDYISIQEVPNEEVAMGQMLTLGLSGNVKTTTLQAFSKEKFAEVLKKLP